MPMELRKIFFSNEEVEVAARRYCMSTGKPLPRADTMYATFNDDIDAMVILHFCCSDRRDPTVVRLTCAEAREALVGFCKRARIPLPRAGKKVLWPQSDGIALMITLESLCDPATMPEISQPVSLRPISGHG